MTAAGTLLTLLALALIFSRSRVTALSGLLFATLYIPQNQNLNIAGLNIFALRLIEVVAFVRIIVRGELTISLLTRIDKLFITFLLFSVTIYLARTYDGAVNRIGVACDAFFSYFAVRGLLKTPADLKSFLLAALLLLIPLALIVTFETFSRYNLFSLLGGQAGRSDMIRDGRLRAFGAFRNPSLLGTVGASFLPLYIMLALARPARAFAIAGIAACLLIVFASNSGGPLAATAVAVFGSLLWTARAYISWLRRLSIATLAILAVAMNAPVWYLLDRLSSLTGGDGYHRARLLDMAFTHLDKWWLMGMPLEETVQWFPYYIHANNSADITNQFLAYGLSSGLISMFIFILFLISIFIQLGRTLKVIALNCTTTPNVPSDTPYLVWAVGVVVSVHIFNWLGISYFDQTYAVWSLHSAIAVSIGVAPILPAYASQLPASKAAAPPFTLPRHRRNSPN